MRKDVFPYRDAAGAERWADPLAIDRRLRRLLGKDPAAAVADFLDDDPGKALPAAERLVWAACEAFGLGPPFDSATGAGVTEAVWSAALFAFTEWWEKNAFGASSCATSSKPTASASATPATSSGSTSTTASA